MYSLSVRLNAIFFYFGCCLLALGIFNVLTTIFIKSKPKVNEFEFHSTSLYNNVYTKYQHSSGYLNMDIDFEDVFDYNTNLIFAWIVVTFEKTPHYNVSVTIWDHIMRRDDPISHHVINTKQLFKYPIVSKLNDLEGKTVYVKLYWEHMPVFGPIIKKRISLGNFKIRSGNTQPSTREVIREVDYEEVNDKLYDLN